MMDLDFITGIGWRDVVLVLAAMVGVYLVLSLMRLFQVVGKRRDGEKREAKRRLSGWEIYPPQEARVTPQVPPSVPVASEPDFARELAKSNTEVELERLRRESAQLREEVARLAEEIALLKATRNVSPLYNEAMTLAQQGMPAAGIAGHCGISIGEAELVASLARSGSEFERQERGEERDERHTDTGNRFHG
ncbi:DUF2802 domain-containing protein [Sulfuritalea hydrogenivorans]|nr:DUF2802 domain-containing protein [Sulfuritalea hydrogenivorans]MDK9713419.1 DUF2802 domain-containing protein [Sulfuritalea sp.]